MNYRSWQLSRGWTKRDFARALDDTEAASPYRADAVAQIACEIASLTFASPEVTACHNLAARGNRLRSECVENVSDQIVGETKSSTHSETRNEVTHKSTATTPRTAIPSACLE